MLFTFHLLALAERRIGMHPSQYPVQAVRRDASRFFAFPPDPPCVLWPPASSPGHCLLAGSNLVNLACAWHSATCRFCGSALAPLVPPAGGVGGLLLSATIAWQISLGCAVHPLPNGCDALQPLSSVRWTLLQISSRSLAVGSLEPLA